MDADPVLGDDGLLDWNSKYECEINDLKGSSSSGLTYPSAESGASCVEMNDLSSPVLASSSINSPGSKFMDHFVGMGFPREVVAETIQENGEENADLVLEALLKKSKASSASSSGTKVMDQFVGMGFPEAMVIKVIQENGEENTDSILETLLTYKAAEKPFKEEPHTDDHLSSEYETGLLDGLSDLDASDEDIMQPEADEESALPFLVNMGYTRQEVSFAIERCGPDATVSELTDFICAAQMAKEADAFYPEEKPVEKPFKEVTQTDSDHLSSEYETGLLDGLSDFDASDEDTMQPEADGESTLPFLVNMGYTRQEASLAIERCGPDATVSELTDFICAAQMAKEADAFYPEEKPKPKLFGYNLLKHKKRNYLLPDMLSRKRQKFELNGDDKPLHLPNPMIGFGVPNESGLVTHRSLPEGAMGPPYFYYENVAFAPKGVWNTISRFLYDVEPEFVDSKYFCAAARKRGYVHNLPIHNRFPLLPLQPLTICDALPMTRRWWPSWDPRTKLNCLQTCIASAKLTERIRKDLAGHEENPPLEVRENVLFHCRKWNLVWVGRNKVAPLEADEVETLLGFPRNHTRGGGISRTDRYKSLGNSFQVDTVAYHLSVLKEMFPEGINLLSLFSGIGGAEVALHRLGIRLKTVVSVEISKESRAIMKSWWEQTNQTGNLIDIEDVQKLDEDRLKELMDRYGDFDLVVGGSPCNNLTGSNRHHRDGLEGKESVLFYYFYQILYWVRNIVRERQSNT